MSREPPYNSGARDWQYNNDYVDANDGYRHSKWLAFMERRLKLAKELLNPEDSVLIVTIDEKEYLRLGLLLEQTFGGTRIQMVTLVTNPAGTGRDNEFSRTNEFLFVVFLGEASIAAGPDNMLDRSLVNRRIEVEWRDLRRRERSSGRRSRPNQFYPVYVDLVDGAIQEVGEQVPHDVDRFDIPVPQGTRAVFPIAPDGREMIWSVLPRRLRWLREQGFARARASTVQFLNEGTVQAIAAGEVDVLGRDDQGAVIAQFPEGAKRLMPKTVWYRDAHNSQAHGTVMLSRLVPGRHFPFPKSLYAVEDAIRFFVKDKPDAVILDFFAGSGTTAHAVARLNKQDGGRRRSIVITNNEVSADEAKDLRSRGLRPGDPEWEALGIFEHITRPRVEAAITGRTPEGNPIAGDYKFTDEFPMTDGFAENVAFFELRYLDADDVDLGLAFDDLAALLWLRAGAAGPIAGRSDAAGAPLPFIWTDHYGVLFEEDRWRRFVSQRPASARTAFLVTDSPTAFAGITAELPTDTSVVRIPDSYLSMFRPDRGRA